MPIDVVTGDVLGSIAGDALVGDVGLQAGVGASGVLAGAAAAATPGLSAMDFASLAAKFGPAIAGAILGGTQGQVGPITQTSTPWNINYLGPLNQSAQGLAGSNQLNLPQVPTLSGLPDLANTNTLNAAITAAINPMQQQFSGPGGTLSTIRSDFGGAGQYGGTRQALAEGTAGGLEAQGEQNTSANIANALYGTNLAYNQARAQQGIANTQWQYGQQFNTAQNQFTAPWTNLLNQSSIASSTGGLGQTSTTQLPTTPWWQTAAGGALAGTAISNKLGSSTTSS